MNKSAEQILKEVDEIEPLPYMTEQMEYLSSIDDSDFFRSEVYQYWAGAEALFGWFSTGRYNGACIGACGCLTQIKSGRLSPQVINEDMSIACAEAIEMDGGIPNNPYYITKDNLIRFAKWQTWIKKQDEEYETIL